jgi:hypothetical protein
MPTVIGMGQFNQFSKANRCGVEFVQVMDQRSAQVEFSTISGTGLHGFHTPFRESKDDENAPDLLVKSKIQVPATPEHDGKPVGNNVKMMIAFHELIHACGLSDDEHTPVNNPDIFCAVFGMEGQDAFKITNLVQPPIVVGLRTAELIRKNWT